MASHILYGIESATGFVRYQDVARAFGSKAAADRYIDTNYLAGSKSVPLPGSELAKIQAKARQAANAPVPYGC